MLTDNRNIKKYSSYSVEDFLQDDYFITSITKPTKESEAFWEQMIQEGIINVHDYKLARYFINSVQVKPEPIFNEDIFTLWEEIEIINKQNLKKKKKHFYIFASSIAGIVALFFFLFLLKNIFHHLPEETESYSNNIENIKAPKIPVKDIQLILAENETVSLEGEEADIIYNENGIAINNKKTHLKKEQNLPDNQIIFNQLIVPAGKRSMLTFAEGTRIWVNAGTRVVYPITFNNNKREIFIDGEAYLEVSINKKSPFIVKTKELEVEVLGTSFNIMAYEKDTTQRIVLVSGSVKVNIGSTKEMILSPTEMLTLKQGKTNVENVYTSDYTSWRHGLYQYKSENLGIILMRLSRYYGKEIECSDIASNFKCSGKLDLKDDLLQVLNGIAKTVPIQCSYNNEKYMITNK